ncbi:hypothetical protein HA43_14865 [Pantoea eucrina]|nr:hypothetical protein HA43_14865 [Pantoea eucrina]
MKIINRELTDIRIRACLIILILSAISIVALYNSSEVSENDFYEMLIAMIATNFFSIFMLLKPLRESKSKKK